MIAVVVVFFVIREHWEHLTGQWIYLLLLLCPLMHFFGHGGHGGHSKTGGSSGESVSTSMPVSASSCIREPAKAVPR